MAFGQGGPGVHLQRYGKTVNAKCSVLFRSGAKACWGLWGPYPIVLLTLLRSFMICLVLFSMFMYFHWIAFTAFWGRVVRKPSCTTNAIEHRMRECLLCSSLRPNKSSFENPKDQVSSGLQQVPGPGPDWGYQACIKSSIKLLGD